MNYPYMPVGSCEACHWNPECAVLSGEQVILGVYWDNESNMETTKSTIQGLYRVMLGVC